MKSFTYTIKDKLGIHARPAGMLAKESVRFKSKITLIKDEKEVETSRLFGILTLGIRSGETVTINVEGEDEEMAVLEMEKFFKDNL